MSDKSFAFAGRREARMIARSGLGDGECAIQGTHYRLHMKTKEISSQAQTLEFCV
jgi:hypothetical protein